MGRNHRRDAIVRSLTKPTNLGNGQTITIDSTRNTDLLTRQTTLSILMKNGCSTLTLLSIYATILKRFLVALITHTEVSLIGFNDARQTYTSMIPARLSQTLCLHRNAVFLLIPQILRERFFVHRE